MMLPRAGKKTNEPAQSDLSTFLGTLQNPLCRPSPSHINMVAKWGYASMRVLYQLSLLELYFSDR